VPSSSAATRERLVRATRDAIREVGIPAATARLIAQRGEANLASITYHFGSKDALVAEALITEARELLAPVWALLAADRPAGERAAEAVTLLSELFDASRSQAPVYLAALASASHVPEVRAGLGDLWGELRSRLADDIRAQLDAGDLPPWVSPTAMAALILSLVNGVVISSVVDAGGPDHREVGAQFLLLLLAVAGRAEPGGAHGREGEP
jgi:AcrR family transcriptional regulator